ncbi:EmrB/QacA subfamily drug resistance transporter [Arthrobacter silviterrae]|uniref:MFS transporter n=1 Tax=Arthrobacter silviterrae TaxID=2026658 RepID=A0ABX0DB44_9MICC|nr:MFS transporter [Arthrobacter silviterrae]MDQ0277783.1 EmrB/QacA subfamily drug resistance transporter [Arthrobacter silviterrae]NGN83851.1 MFS transporter [Arthrobacter silviterrae]
MERRVLWVAILASFVAFLDGAIVNVALPAMTRELGGGITTQQWVVDAYLLTLGSLILIAGSLSDTLGRVRILRAGLLVFGVASLACAFAPSALLLVVSRAVQGAGAALLVPSSLALITSTFSGPAQGKAIGRWTAWTGTAFLAGPLLGGLLVDYSSWRLVFAINVLPIAATFWLLRGLALPAAAADDAGSPTAAIDVTGAVLASVGLAGTVFALIEQDRLGWGSPAVFVPFTLGVAALAVFLWWEARTAQPMMPLPLFRTRNFGMGNVATAFIYAGVSLGGLMMVLFLQEVAGFSAALAGLASMPTAVIMLLLSGPFGTLAGKYGPRLFMAVGPIVAGTGYLLMATTSVPFNFWLHILPGILVFAVGMSMTVAPLTGAILGAVPTKQSGIGSAINNAVSRVAGLIAVALAGVMLGGVLDFDSFRRIVAITAALFITGGVISALGIVNTGLRGVKQTQAAA